MKKVSAIVVVLTLLGSAAAFGQSYGDRGITGAQNDYQQGRQQNDNQGANRFQTQANNEVRGTPRWSRGDRLPTEYRGNQYVVSDWKNNNLRKPPRGYHWMRTNNNDQYVLAAVATGIIADVMMSNQRGQRTR